MSFAPCYGLPVKVWPHAKEQTQKEGQNDNFMVDAHAAHWQDMPNPITD
jgi:hypothetical protein